MPMPTSSRIQRLLLLLLPCVASCATPHLVGAPSGYEGPTAQVTMSTHGELGGDHIYREGAIDAVDGHSARIGGEAPSAVLVTPGRHELVVFLDVRHRPGHATPLFGSAFWITLRDRLGPPPQRYYRTLRHDFVEGERYLIVPSHDENGFLDLAVHLR